MTGHSLSERSQSQIRKQHNEIEFFGTKLCLHKDFANQKACIFIAVNFRHYQFWNKKPFVKNNFFMHIFVRDVYYQMHLHKCKRNRGPLARKIVKNQYLKTRMEYWSNSSMTKVDRSKKRWFGICGILKKSFKSSEKYLFIM